jgi:gamma-glutamyltranspeptidase/glutathione hydrolase
VHCDQTTMPRGGPYERAAGVFAEAAVAHEHPDAVAAGMAMLRAGGNAVDAAVAVAFAACVVMPASTTIAGSGFMLVDPGTDDEPVAIEFPPRAPLAASPDMYPLDEAERVGLIGVSSVLGDANLHGPLSVGVPAVVAGLCAAQERFGRLSVADVIAPAIELARAGFATHAELQLQTLEVLPQLRADSPGLRGTLLTHDGLPVGAPAGAPPPRIAQPELATTLEAIARDGADGFYRGEPGRTIVAEVGRKGGILSLDDLARTQALVTTPLSIRLGDAVAYAPTSPNGGWTELQILGVLARLGGMLDGSGPFSLRTYLHASWPCFADRYHFMGDPDHVDVPLGVLLGDEYLDALAAAVAEREPAGVRVERPAPAPWSHYAFRVPEAFARFRPDLLPTSWESTAAHAAGLGDSFETTHLSTIDAGGMAVSCTLTAAHAFGSKVTAAGVVLDDAMIWFNAAPGAANSIAPWKRPLANMGPLLVRRDGRTLAVGAPGGRRIVSAVSQVVAHWLRGDDLERATARPRVDGSGAEVLASGRLGADEVRELIAAGRRVRVVEDRDPFCFDFARPVAVAAAADGRLEAAVQPYVRGMVAGN